MAAGTDDHKAAKNGVLRLKNSKLRGRIKKKFPRGNSGEIGEGKKNAF